MDMELIIEHKGLVHHVVNKLLGVPQHHPYYEDMIQEGYVGMMAALNKFDKNEASSFSTFATYHIRWAVLKYFREFLERPINIRREDYQIAKKYIKTKDYEETMSSFNVSKEEVDKAVKIFNEISNMDHLHREVDEGNFNGGGNTLEDMTVLYTDRNAYEDYINHHIITNALKVLDDREKEMIKMFYFDNKSQPKIGETFNLSQPQVSRILKRALSKMRTQLEGGC